MRDIASILELVGHGSGYGLLIIGAVVASCCWATGADGDEARARMAGAVLYVAPDGNDAWTGARPTAQPGRNDGPLATLNGARDAIRARRAAGKLAAGGVEVHVRAGTYEMAAPLSLAAEDGGTEAAPVVYRAYPDEQVILTGSRLITGFVPHQGNILKADVGAQGFGDIYFRELFLNGKRQVLARYPNFDPANPHGGGFAYVAGKPVNMYTALPNEELRVISLRAKDVRRWANPQLGEVIIFPRYNWINLAIPIASADPQAATITLSKDARPWGDFSIRPLDRFYVRNLIEELDAPGEWYLDRETATLYFWPPEPIESATVRAPVTPTLIEIGDKAAWITIRGFTLEGCEGTAIALNNAENCLIAGNTIHDTGSAIGGSAGVVVSGGRSCGIVGNDIFNVANDGIRLSSDQHSVETLTLSGHYVENNYIHHIGHLNGHGNGIFFWAGVGVRVSHNLIHDTTRCGIYGNGTDCIVEYNHIRHVSLETEDTGGFYTASIAWHVRGLVVRYNYIHDVLGYGRTGDRWTSPHFGWGIYLDDDYSGAHVHGNIVVRNTNGGVMIHGGRDNLVENNILVDSSRQQVQYQEGRAPGIVKTHMQEFAKAMTKPAYRARYPELATADPENMRPMAGNRSMRNIIAYGEGSASVFLMQMEGAPGTNQSDHNIIWRQGLPVDARLGWDKLLSWEQWKALGLDANSVIADPMFVDPSKGDYRLKPESPALKMGFAPIPVEKIGPYASELRASWPIIEAPGVRETPLVETKVEMEE